MSTDIVIQSTAWALLGEATGRCPPRRESMLRLTNQIRFPPTKLRTVVQRYAALLAATYWQSGEPAQGINQALQRPRHSMPTVLGAELRATYPASMQRASCQCRSASSSGPRGPSVRNQFATLSHIAMMAIETTVTWVAGSVGAKAATRLRTRSR